MFPLAVSLGMVAIPACVSVAVKPWAYAVTVTAAPTFDLPGETALLQLARVESLHIYTGTLQTLMTPAIEWPSGTPRDACLIQTPAKDANAPPPTAIWTDRTLRRMFADRLDPAEVRRLYYERGATLPGETVARETAWAIAFLHAMEPYAERVRFGDTRYFHVPEEMEYRQRTGVEHILSLAVEPPLTRTAARSAREPASALAAPIAEVINEAKQRGVKFLAIPFLGANAGEGLEVDIYEVLLNAAIATAANSGSLQALYVGAYADSPTRREELIAALNRAWRPARLKLQQREQELVDVGWRLTSVMSIAALVSLSLRNRLRKLSMARAMKWAVAVLLLSKGLAETVSPLVALTALPTLPPPIVFLTIVAFGGILGWYLPRAVLFDPKALLQDEVVEP